MVDDVTTLPVMFVTIYGMNELNAGYHDPDLRGRFDWHLDV